MNLNRMVHRACDTVGFSVHGIEKITITTNRLQKQATVGHADWTTGRITITLNGKRFSRMNEWNHNVRTYNHYETLYAILVHEISHLKEKKHPHTGYPEFRAWQAIRAHRRSWRVVTGFFARRIKNESWPI